MYPTVYLVSPLGCLIGVSHLTCSSSWTSPLFKKFLYSQSSSFQMIPIPNFQIFRQKTCVHPWYLFLSHITIQTISKFHRIYFQNISTIQSLLPTTTDRTEASPSLAWITVGCPCWSLPQICSLFLVQETKRYIKNISWVISLFSSKPSNGFLLTQSKIQVLTRMYKKPYTIWSLSLWSHLLLPLFLHSLCADILASLLRSQVRNSSASEPEHTQFLWLKTSFSPDICKSLPHLLQVFTSIFSLPCYFKLNPTSILILYPLSLPYFSL